MLTLHKNDQTIQIAKLQEGRSATPIYWHPTQNEELMSAVHDLGTFNNAYFRDRFELSEEQAGHIKKSEKAADNDRQAVWRDSSGSGDNFL